MEPFEMKELFARYIKPIFKIKEPNQPPQNSSLYIHLRSGDLFCSRPHPAYVPPPLSYYKELSKKFDKVVIIAEDGNHPCMGELYKLNNAVISYDSLENDLATLSKAENLAIGYGTFGFLIYLMNSCLKTLHLPRYCLDALPKGSWGNDTVLHVIDLPNYIKVGDWKNTDEQRKMLLEYEMS
jgi:hypothetical protein